MGENTTNLLKKIIGFEVVEKEYLPAAGREHRSGPNKVKKLATCNPQHHTWDRVPSGETIPGLLRM